MQQIRTSQVDRRQVVDDEPNRLSVVQDHDRLPAVPVGGHVAMLEQALGLSQAVAAAL